jgi:putative ABC transport system permease protein
MVRDAVGNGQVAASWQAAGADVTISDSQSSPGFSIPPAAVRAVAAVPGVVHAAAAWPATWLTPDGGQLTVLAVDPASYAALTAAAPGYPAVKAALLAAPSAPGAPQPVLASPRAVALLKHAPVKIGSAAPVAPVTVQVAGTLTATPGWPAGGAFAIMPLAALRSPATPPAPVTVSELLLTGAHIDRARLAAVLRADLPSGGSVIYRADVLAGLTTAPLPHGAATLITLSLLAAAGLLLAVMFLELALGAAERSAVLARLATMGLGEGQRAWVVALEVLPAVLAGPGIDLSVFTRSPAEVPLAPGVSFSVPAPLVTDIAAVALPLAALLVLAALALAVETGWTRRRGAAARSLRMGG